MTDKEKFMAQVIAGLCANSKYVHEKRYSKDGLAKNIVKDAKEIVDEFYKESTQTA
jgi:hypothetical protein